MLSGKEKGPELLLRALVVVSVCFYELAVTLPQARRSTKTLRTASIGIIPATHKRIDSMLLGCGRNGFGELSHGHSFERRHASVHHSTCEG